MSTDVSAVGIPSSAAQSTRRPLWHIRGRAPSPLFLIGATSLAAGLLALTASLAWMTQPRSTLATRCLGTIFCITGAWSLLGSRQKLLKEKEEEAPSLDRQVKEFHRYIAGLGYVLVLVGLCNAITAAGLIRMGHVELSGQRQESTVNLKGNNALDPAVRAEAAWRLGMLLILSTEMSILGALFFVTNRMRKRCPKPKHAGGHDLDPEPFDPRHFWGGLLFRLGEAILFTFTFFWLFWKYADSADYTWLPIVGLFLGMFVKSGETVVFGIGERLLAAAAAFFPSPQGPAGRTPTEEKKSQPPGRQVAQATGAAA